MGSDRWRGGGGWMSGWVVRIGGRSRTHLHDRGSGSKAGAGQARADCGAGAPAWVRQPEPTARQQHYSRALTPSSASMNAPASPPRPPAGSEAGLELGRPPSHAASSGSTSAGPKPQCVSSGALQRHVVPPQLAEASVVLWPIEFDAASVEQEPSCALPASVPPSCRTPSPNKECITGARNNAGASMQEEWLRRRRIVGGLADRSKGVGWGLGWRLWCGHALVLHGRVGGSGWSVAGAVGPWRWSGGWERPILCALVYAAGGGTCGPGVRMLSQRHTVWEEPRQGDGRTVWGARPDGSGHHKATK